MTPPTVDRNTVERLIDLAAERLEGDWVLIGGAVAVAWLGSTRTTRDIDVFSIRGSLADRLGLMDLAAEIGLPVEAVNPAADFFVRRLPDWQSMLEPLVRGSRATIHRPGPTLFLLTKIGRLSESDLHDCLLLTRRAAEGGWPLDATRVRRDLAALPPTDDADLRARREALARALPA